MYKIVIYTCIFFILFLTQLSAQEWVRQHPFPVLASMQAITFDEQGHGWTVGGNSTILHTDNWGVNWDIQTPIPLGVALLSVEIVPGSNGQKALIGGNTFIMTEDGGQTWEHQPGSSNPIDQIQALDDQNYFAFGYNDTSRKTTDGGQTWTDFPNPVASGKTYGSFIDPMNGWATAGSFNDGHIYRTMDGGQNWTLLDTTTHVSFNGIEMMDAQNGFMSSTEHIFKTIDGGNTWTIISNQTLPSTTDFHVVDDQQIWACNNNGSIYYTFNGGTSWTHEFPSETFGNSPKGIYAIDGGQAWVAGKYTSILYTGNSGQDWQDLTHGNKGTLLDINFYDENHGMASGYNGVFLKTDDGGAIWQDISAENPEEGFLGVAMTSSQTAYRVTDSGDVQKSTNGGQSWTSIGDEMLNSALGMTVISDQHICVHKFSDIISITMNGGNTWTQFSTEFARLTDMHFSSDNIGWMASNDGNILKTIDGGLTWNTINVNSADDFQSVFFIDDMEGWVVGNFVDSLFHTTDGGLNWELQELPLNTFWRDISFMNSDIGWLVGGSSGRSKIMATTDGGQTWEQVYTDIAQLQTITSLGNGKAWTAGAGGNILHLAPCVTPVLNNLTGPQQLCEGDTAQYQVNSDEVIIFDWQLPNDWIFLSNSNAALIEILVGADQGVVQLIGSNSCGFTSDPISLNVTVDSATNLNLIVNDDNLLEVLPSGLSYSWFLNGELIEQSTNNTYTAQTGGLYHVIVLFESDCSSTSDIVNVMITDNEHLSFQAAIHVFPNPTNGVFRLQLPNNLSNAQIILRDNTARPLIQKTHQEQTTLDFSTFKSGIYYLEIRADQGVFYKRVVFL